MDTFAPEFSKFWLADAAPKGAEPAQAADDEANRDNAALKALADLVSAARSIV
jgi:hypothetical protein